jgi:uncharacterized protein YjiS (DUF1127 family)
MMMTAWRTERRQTMLRYRYSQSPLMRRQGGTPARVLSTGSARPDKLSGLIRRVIATFRLWRQNARSRHELLRLSERELKDIGLTRYEALYEANRPFWDCGRGPNLHPPV